ncbi:MAG: thioredoxin [Gaiellales bacterium]|jgi:thioredoxin|nr:thioredoxin [Gaiellales bacterium]
MTPIDITKDNFEQEVLKSDQPVLLDLWAAWCGPCRMVSPIVDEIAQEYDGKLKVGKIDVDAEQELATAFQVQSIPMILVMKDGEVVSGALGARPKAALIEALELDTHTAAAAA